MDLGRMRGIACRCILQVFDRRCGVTHRSKWHTGGWCSKKLVCAKFEEGGAGYHSMRTIPRRKAVAESRHRTRNDKLEDLKRMEK